MIIWNGPYETQCTRLAAGNVIDLESSQGGDAGFISTGTLSVKGPPRADIPEQLAACSAQALSTALLVLGKCFK